MSRLIKFGLFILLFSIVLGRSVWFYDILKKPELFEIKVLAQESQNPADFIMKTVTKRALDNDNLKKDHLEYKRVYKIEGLNSREEPTGLKKNEVILISNGVEKLIEEDGRPVKGSTSSGSAPSINFDNALAGFYVFTMAEAPIIAMNNRAYHVIKFQPKTNSKPNGDVEEILARLTGILYIDVEKLFIYKLNATLTRDYKRGWFIYNLRRADIELEQMEFHNIVVVNSFKVIDRYSVFGVEIFERQIIMYTDYVYKQ